MISFQISSKQENISNLIEKVLDDSFNEEGFETNGLKVFLKRVGETNSTIGGKNLYIDLPMEVLVKKEAGLFTAEAHGAIDLKVGAKIDINNDFKIKFTTDLIDHEWLDKPKLDIGVFDIPVEKILNLMIGHYESIITAKIDNQLNNNIDLQQQIVKQIEFMDSKLSENARFNIRPFLRPKELLMEDPFTENGYFKWSGLINFDLSITEDDKKFKKITPKLRWIDKVGEDNVSIIYADIDYSNISVMLRDFLEHQNYGGKKVVIDDLKLTPKNGKISIDMDISEPVNGKVSMVGNPVFNEYEQKLFVKELSFNFDADNLLLRLTTPLFNKYFKSVISELLPLDLKPIVNSLLEDKIDKKYSIEDTDINIDISNVQISEMLFLEERVSLTAKILDANIKVEL